MTFGILSQMLFKARDLSFDRRADLAPIAGAKLLCAYSIRCQMGYLLIDSGFKVFVDKISVWLITWFRKASWVNVAGVFVFEELDQIPRMQMKAFNVNISLELRWWTMRKYRK